MSQAVRYADDPARLERARRVGPGVAIESPRDIERLEPHLQLARDGTMTHPQTYVVTAKDARFRCGGPLEEHVEVAGGDDVLAVGEVWFARDDDASWRVDRINNRSIGYRLPGRHTYEAAARALDAAGIPHPGEFTSLFTGRTCPACGLFNVWPGEVAPYCKACGEDFA